MKAMSKNQKGKSTSLACTDQAKGRRGRPREYDRDDILDQFERFIEETDRPSIDKFCAKVSIPRIPPSTFYEWNEGAELRELAEAKSRDDLVEGGLTGRYSQIMAIFAAKNCGMADRQEHELSGKIQTDGKLEIVVVNTSIDPITEDQWKERLAKESEKENG